MIDRSMAGPPTVAVAARLDRRYADLLELVRTADRQLGRHQLESAAVWAQVAGTFAWFNPSGVFSSPELEDLLGRIGASLPPADAPRRTQRSPSAPREVLHVVTQIYATGGPTQAIACWVEQDQTSHHRVCLTRQGAAEVPDKIVGRLADPADLIRLDTGRDGLTGRAARLRALASGADVVVLHSHPYDVVPVMAFASPDGMPPVVYVNHADHVFWLGTNAATAVMHMRDSGRVLAETRRGIEPARSAVMARPLRLRRRELSRAEAKCRLGVSPDRVLVVTAADGAKYRPIASPSFLELVVPVIEDHPESVLLAAGPSPDADWTAAGERTGGRIRALGRLPDVTTLHQAADIYLDSFPFSSLTSLLEAGSFGTPVITYRGHPPECGVLGADTRGVDDLMRCPGDPDSIRRDLSVLIEHASVREELGRRTMQAILDTHTGSGWQQGVVDLYDFAGTIEGRQAPGPSERGTGALDCLVDLVMDQTGYSQGVPGAVAANVGLLPGCERIRTWSGLARAGYRPEVRAVLPEWSLPWLAQWRRRLRRSWLAGLATLRREG